MSTNVAVFGLGKIGASIALALKTYGKNCHVIGEDLLKSVEEDAKGKGWVDEAVHNIYNAVRNAALVILALPADQTREMLELLGQDLNEGTILLDCCPDKAAAAAWSRQYMAHPENFAGIWPGINPAFLFETSGASLSVSADLFRGAEMQVGIESDTSENTIRTASGLAAVLGMETSFIDPLELDGMLAGTEQLPFLLSCGLFHTCAQRPGWTDAKKIAGKRFSLVTSVLKDAANVNGEAAMLLNNRENNIRLLDELIVSLNTYRDALKNEDEAGLRQLLEQDRAGYQSWLKEYGKSNQTETELTPMPKVSAAEVLSQTFLGGLLRKKKGH